VITEKTKAAKKAAFFNSAEMAFTA